MRKTGTSLDLNLVYNDGTRSDADIGDVGGYATEAAKDFSVDSALKEVNFEIEKAKTDLTEAGDTKLKTRSRAKK